ncbi:MAG: hypothetical protein QOE88_2626 [Verrucomicrobiota bacterium]|nr:hypothetical protein [Verrucomicrobiota bacterium]
MRYKCSHCEHSVYEGTRRGKESTEGELFYHRGHGVSDSEKRRTVGGPAVDDYNCYPIRIFFPEPGVLCVSVVNQFPSVLSSPLCVLKNPSGKTGSNSKI